MISHTVKILKNIKNTYDCMDYLAVVFVLMSFSIILTILGKIILFFI